jgi:hypothetical protein
MTEFFRFLVETNLVTAAFVIGAIAFVIAIIGQFKTIIEPSPAMRILLAVFGLFLMALSFGSYFVSSQTKPNTADTSTQVSTSPPVVQPSATVSQAIATTRVPPTQSAVVTQPSSLASYCYGTCWQYDENSRTMTWTGPLDGTEDIWQGDEISLSRIRNGWTAIFGPVSVPGEIEACVLTLDGQIVVNSCDGVQHPYPVDANKSYQVTSAHSEVGGFRWKPAKGYGYRTP